MTKSISSSKNGGKSKRLKATNFMTDKYNAYIKI